MAGLFFYLVSIFVKLFFWKRKIIGFINIRMRNNWVWAISVAKNCSKEFATDTVLLLKTKIRLPPNEHLLIYGVHK